MKITKKALQKIIKEEYSKLMFERELKSLQENFESIPPNILRIDDMVVQALSDGDHSFYGELLWPIGEGTWDAVSDTMNFLEGELEKGNPGITQKDLVDYYRAVQQQAKEEGMSDAQENIEGGLPAEYDGRAEEEAHSWMHK